MRGFGKRPSQLEKQLLKHLFQADPVRIEIKSGSQLSELWAMAAFTAILLLILYPDRVVEWLLAMAEWISTNLAW